MNAMETIVRASPNIGRLNLNAAITKLRLPSHGIANNENMEHVLL